MPLPIGPNWFNQKPYFCYITIKKHQGTLNEARQIWVDVYQALDSDEEGIKLICDRDYFDIITILNMSNICLINNRIVEVQDLGHLLESSRDSEGV